MQIEFIEESEFRVKFILKKAPIAFANSFRRAMKSLVPTMAIDYVDFYLNTSFLYDEILAHRLGLIPIKTNLNKFNLPEKCSCGGEGCPLCQVSFRLNVEGPRIIYSGDLISDDPETKPVYDNIPIIELYEGQQLMIEAVARLGVGKEHAKFQPVSVCAYRIIPTIKIDEKCVLCGECIKVCHKNVFKEENGKIVIKNEMDCTLCLQCAKACPENALHVLETNNYLFTVEGCGQLPVRIVMTKAAETLKEKAQEMNKIIEELLEIQKS